MPSRRVRWPGVLIGALGLLLLAVSCVLAVDLRSTSVRMQREVVRTEELILTNVRTLGQTQRELLRLLHLLDVQAPADEIDLQVAFVSQRAQESALSRQLTTLGSEGLMETARADERRWRTVVLPELTQALRSDDDRLLAEAKGALIELERSYNELASAAETHRRTQIASTNRTTADLTESLDRLMLLLALLLLASIASSATGTALFVRADRHRKRAVSELSALNDDLLFYSRVIQATDSALLATAADGRVTWVNDAFERVTGWRLEHVRGRFPTEFLLAPATEAEVVERLVANVHEGRPVRVEIACQRVGGDFFWSAADVSPLQDGAGRAEGFFVVLTDVTERREAQDLLVEARRAAEETAQQKAAFLATMSHEIRTPLNAVLGLTDLLLQTDLDAEQRDYAETAHRSGDHLLALINDVLDYSSLESGRMEYAEEPFSIRGLLADTLAMFASQAEVKQVALDLDCAPDVPAAVRGDETRLRQVLVNLVGNALKFTERGGVTVTCSVVRTTEGTGEAVCELLTTISDTGIGIPRWRIPDLFQSFVRGDASTTREYGGTGLGLAICRGLVEAMDGRIELESEVGRGTRVLVRTRHRVAAASFAPVPEPLVACRTVDPRQLTVLVAEDDVVNRKVITGMLGRLGIVPTIVGNGREALDLLHREAFDVVLMDVEMPVMDGVSAVRRLRADPPPVRPHVIALTANALAGDRERFLEAGMDDYLSKPVTLGSLTAALGSVARCEPVA